MKTLNELPIGQVLVQSWCNSVSFYKVIAKSAKSVTMVELPKKYGEFEHDGGGCGTYHVKPDFDKYNEFMQFCEENGGFDQVMKFVFKKDFTEKADHRIKAWQLVDKCRSYKPFKKIVKTNQDGDLVIPGKMTGSWCRGCSLWDETCDCTEYWT